MSRLFHVSDLHFGREDTAAIAWFAERVRAEQPDAVLITGDLTMRAHRHEFEAAAAWIGALGVPLTIEVGNHDLPYFNLWNRFVRPYARYERIERAIERPLDLADVAIVPLKTTARAQLRTNWSHGIVRGPRLREAVRTLNALPEPRVRIVTVHHPLLDKPGGNVEGRTRGGLAALHALSAAGTDVVLSGHVHDPFDIMWTDGPHPVRLIGAGTLSERIRSTPPSYNELVVEGLDIHVTVRTMDAPLAAPVA